MKICAFSDIHGNLIHIDEKCDIVLICGDIMPLAIQYSINKSLSWLRTKYLPWCEGLPCDKVIYIAGNHDFFFYKKIFEIKQYQLDSPKVQYLYCDIAEYQGVRIFGTPWCQPFGRWAFSMPTDLQEKMYNDEIKRLQNIDIIMSHDAPFGVSDVLLQDDYLYTNGKHIGNVALSNLITNVKPKIFLHGHLHSTNHEAEMLNDCKVYNVSILNEFYTQTYQPLYLDVDKNL